MKTRIVLIGLFSGLLFGIATPFSGLISAVFIILGCNFWGLDNHLSALIDGVSVRTITFIKGITFTYS